MSGPYRALDHRFQVRAADPAVDRYLAGLLAGLLDGLVSGASPPASYALVPHRSDNDRWQLWVNDQATGVSPDLGHALDLLLSTINRAAVQSVSGALVLHAASATRHGRALVLAGRSGAGKTTLVAELARRGLRYLTDEASAIDLSSSVVRSFAKPLLIEPGSQPLFADLDVPATPEVDGDQPRRWLLPPGALREGAVAPSTALGWLATVSYSPGSGTQLVPLRPPDAIPALAEHWFRPPIDNEAGLVGLARLAAGVPCFRLLVGDLDEACRVLLDLTSNPPAGPAS